MSAPPDFMQRLMAGLQAGISNPLLQTGIGIMGAAGPSRMPVSLGDALSGGLQQGQQLQAGQLQNAMQQLMLGQNMYGLQALKDANSNQGNAPIPPAFQQYAPPSTQAPPDQSQTPQPSPQSAQPSGPVTAPTSVPMPPNPLMPRPTGTTAQTPTQKIPQAPAWMQQVAQDTQRLNALSASPMWAKQAEDLRTRMQNSWFDLPDSLVPGGVVPGQHWQVNELGEKKPLGEGAIKTVQIMGPAGTMVTVPYDTRTGQVKDIGGTLTPKDYTKPLASPSLEQQAEAVAQYRQMPPNVSSRDPGAADIRGRANYLLQDFGGLDDTTFAAKKKAMDSLAAGKDYQQNSAYSTIQTHMQTLQQAMQAVNNGDVQSANKLTQWAGKQFGKSAPQNAKVVNDIVVGELAKVLAQGGQVTDSVRNEAAGDLEPYLSKGQFQGAIQYIQQLIAGKMSTSHLNAQANHIPDDVFMAHLSPEARQQLQMFEATHQGQTSSTAAGGNGWSIVKVP